MRITFRVDQAACLRAGINAPNSTAHVDLDPAELTEEQRAKLAEWVENGHDATRWPAPSVLGLDVAALVAAINEAIEEDREKVAREKAEHEKTVAEVLAHPIEDWLTSDSWGRPIVRAPHSYPNVEDDPRVEARSQEAERVHAPHIEAWQQEQEEKRAREAAKREAAEREEAERKAREREEYAELYTRLPETLRARHEEGFASDSEVNRQLRRLIREDAGYLPSALQTSEGGGWQHSESISELSDDEYKRLVKIREQAPKGAEVEPRLTYDGHRGYRQATDDEYDEADADNEVWEDGENVRRQIVVTWSRAGLKTAIGFPLD